MLCIIFISVQDLQRSWTPHNNLGPDCFETYSDQRIFAFPGSSGTISVSNPGLPEPETRFLAIFYYPKPVFFSTNNPGYFKKNWNCCCIQIFVYLITLSWRVARVTAKSACLNFKLLSGGKFEFCSLTTVRSLLARLYPLSIDIFRPIVISLHIIRVYANFVFFANLIPTT